MPPFANKTKFIDSLRSVSSLNLKRQFVGWLRNQENRSVQDHSLCLQRTGV